MSTSKPPMLADLVNLHDHELRARQTLSEAAQAYFLGGAADELTLQANRQAWQRLNLLPRVLRPLADSHCRTTLLGRALAHPLLLAPIAYQKLAHPDGEIATALAASAQQAGLILSTQASTRLEDVAQVAGPAAQRGPLWFQLYLLADRAQTLALVRRAEAAGYEALVLTVDAPVQGPRDRERRARFALPPGIGAVNLPAPPPSAQTLADLLAQAATWDDVAWLQGQTRLPLLLKGILHPQDAVQAAALGVAGVIVSNHGGRTLDTAPATATQLPRIRAAVGPDFALLVDGGIRRGTDVLKAIALGADAVLIGRPCIHGLAHAGAWGVAHVLKLLQDELRIAMALSGCRTLADAQAELLVP